MTGAHAGLSLVRLARAALTGVVAVAVAAAPAAAQEQRERAPTADHLWEAYPLDDGSPPAPPSPAPTAAARRERAATTAAAGTAGRDDGGGVPAAALAAAAGGIALAAGGWVLWRRRRKGAPDVPGRPADGARPARRTAQNGAMRKDASLRLAEWPAAMRSGKRFDRTRAPQPPDPHQHWDAAIRWELDAHIGRFRVMAACASGEPPAELARSEPIEWPPTGAGAQALTAAVERLADDLLAAGWRAQPGGEAWYERRFAWSPVAPPSTAAVAAPPPAGATLPMPPELVGGEQPWPGGEDLCWCRIRWHGGWKTSRFEAVAMAPDKRRGECVAASTEFKWMLRADPDPAVADFGAAVEALSETLRAAGWEPVGQGREWYALWFVWGREGQPPERARAIAGNAQAR